VCTFFYMCPVGAWIPKQSVFKEFLFFLIVGEGSQWLSGGEA